MQDDEFKSGVEDLDFPPQKSIWLRRNWKWICCSAAAFFLLWFIPPVWRLQSGEVEVTQWRKNGGELKAIVGPDRKDWIWSHAVSKNISYAIVVAEDARFYDHGGIDMYEMWSSFNLNLKKKRYARGASTITQQVVKMAFLSRDKSIIRKMREVVGAVLLELILTKSQIISWYINLAEFGDGVYGLRAAAKHYFQTKPELLTIEQAAHLALVLPSPNGWSVGLRKRNLTSFGEKRYATIITNMKLGGYITETQWRTALATGNFGRPVHAYERFLEQQQQSMSKESIAEQIVEEGDQAEATEEALLPETVTGVSETTQREEVVIPPNAADASPESVKSATPNVEDPTQ